ncbi:MAG: hypothetical protein KDC38_02820 [Planctomycetes bacterium]|nr:hypothetical protein [Planctomycetota bacterium]
MPPSGLSAEPDSSADAPFAMARDIADWRTAAPRLATLLRRAALRRRRHAALNGFLWGLSVAALGALGVVITWKLVWPGWDLVRTAECVAAIGLGCALLGAALAAALRSSDPVATALAIENQVDLAERLSSIVFLERSIAGGGPAAHADPLATAALYRDGDEAAARVDLRSGIPFRRPRALFVAVGLLFAVGAASLLPQFDLLGAEQERAQVAKEEKRVREARERQRKRLEEIVEKAKRAKVDPRTEKLLQKMSQPEEQRTEAEKRPPAKQDPQRRELAKMDELRREAQELREREEMKSLDRMLEQIQSSAQKLESQEAKDMQSALQKGDLSSASQAMKKLADKISEAQKSGDKDELSKLSKDLNALLKKLDGLPQSEELSKAAADLAKMDPKDLAKAMESTASQLDQLERLMRERDLLDQTLSEIELTENELASLPQEWPEPCELCKNGGT